MFSCINPNEVLEEGSKEVTNNVGEYHNALLVPLPSFGFSETAKEIQ